MDVDINGATMIYETGLACNWIFVSVPSSEELEKRLIAQQLHDNETIKKRVAVYESEV